MDQEQKPSEDPINQLFLEYQEMIQAYAQGRDFPDNLIQTVLEMEAALKKAGRLEPKWSLLQETQEPPVEQPEQK